MVKIRVLVRGIMWPALVLCAVMISECQNSGKCLAVDAGFIKDWEYASLGAG